MYLLMYLCNGDIGVVENANSNLGSKYNNAKKYGLLFEWSSTTSNPKFLMGIGQWDF